MNPDCLMFLSCSGLFGRKGFQFWRKCRALTANHDLVTAEAASSRLVTRAILFNRLTDNLAPEFEMIDEPRDIPFVIRDTTRKFKYINAQMTVWKKQ